jgi:hypothetical protein
MHTIVLVCGVAWSVLVQHRTDDGRECGGAHEVDRRSRLAVAGERDEQRTIDGEDREGDGEEGEEAIVRCSALGWVGRLTRAGAAGAGESSASLKPDGDDSLAWERLPVDRAVGPASPRCRPFAGPAAASHTPTRRSAARPA